jgi:hypothetical protein
MKRTVSIFAGGAALALANVAVAGEAQMVPAAEPLLLTDAQMDGVTAAGARVSATLTGNAIVDGKFLLDNLPGVFSIAEISAKIFPFGDAVVKLKAHADTFD